MAVRLPRGLGIGADEMFELQGGPDGFKARRIPSPEEQAERLKRFRAGLAALQALGPIGEIEVREPILIPDRAGL